jgi:hypothetical protein
LVLVVFLVALAPFFATYLPVRSEYGGRSWELVESLLPVASDLSNVGPENLVWGDLLAREDGRRWPGNYRKGYPPLFLGTLLLGTALAGRRTFRGDPPRTVADSCSSLDLWTFGLGSSVVTCWILMFPVAGVSAWRLVHDLVPGAEAIRVVFRLQLVASLAASAVVAVTLDRAMHRSKGRWRSGAIALFCLVLLAEQVNLRSHGFSKDLQRERLGAVEIPPPECSAFVLAPGPVPSLQRPGREAEWFEVQHDAMLVAQRFGVPTLNGRSGILPSGWRLHRPDEEDYSEDLRSWRKRHGLVGGVCTLDLSTGRWMLLPEPLSPGIDS